MELKYTIATIFLLFLLLDLPRFSSCDDHERLKGEDSSTEEVYEIDYRGPETHPILPFPPRGRPRLRRQHPYFKPPPQSKDSKVNRERG
ncbi:uncharacterized protein LOC116195721 [Punica granatum]|uniref:Uncharacterized protein LOC116195721 n=1 Tax=Punica granatum TaxID=22663 RepID=A0A6P8CHG9_PUNGR|nr:uncharacterized protein LOC116195721 [Punica granatum]